MEQRAAPVLCAIDDCIEKFTADRKQNISPFIEKHFTVSGEGILMDYIRKDPVLGPMVASGAVELDQRRIRTEVLKEIEKYTSSHAMISDICSSLLPLAAGWIYFGDKSLGVLGLGSRFARKIARENASSNFFLGEKVGSVFYGVFPPAPTRALFSAILFRYHKMQDNFTLLPDVDEIDSLCKTLTENGVTVSVNPIPDDDPTKQYTLVILILIMTFLFVLLVEKLTT